MSIHYYHYHHNDDWETRFFGGENNGQNLFMGIELEVDSMRENDNDSCSDSIQNLFPDGFIYFEDDGSLENGFENITSPATLNFHLQNKENYCEMFKYLVSKGYRSFNTNTCGMHVHVNKNFLESDETIENILYIFDKFWDNIQIFSRRNSDTLNRWARKNDKDPIELVDDMHEGYSDRYSCVNLCNENTIEFRIFRGTLNPKSFFASLIFIDNLVRICNDSNRHSIKNKTWEDFIPESIKDYWRAVKNYTERN